MKKILFSSLAILTLTSSIYANSNTGCGLWSVLIKNQNSVLMQLIAVSTNGTSGNQTFGITSGTLNCERKSLVFNDKLHKFVTENMDDLAMDISSGQGETLSTVAKLLNVKDSVSFNKKLKENFTNIYSNQDVTSSEVIDSLSKYI